jgi:hypothetical protein
VNEQVHERLGVGGLVNTDDERPVDLERVHR